MLHALLFHVRYLCPQTAHTAMPCLVFLQPEELDSTTDSDVVDDYLREVNGRMHL